MQGPGTSRVRAPSARGRTPDFGWGLAPQRCPTARVQAMMGTTRRPRERIRVTNEELVVEFALARLDNPDFDLEETAVAVVRRVGPDQMLQFAAQNLAVRGELRGGAFESAVEYVLRVVLTLRDDADG
jgi:hypothetical protein